ncbi:hypothetical protein OESDEN_05356 [Oesophagostomum dentatum]|uniref:Major facilitator superfamily (MFS) profile domain-containing protein n=1 Tax=Oesophagostomum dentatum TaxID=61180 RepID=A0A0B1TH47_OESDE|nr:hypothetical protein OESDEN_05356 [Oesophagostomum dentatum]
MSVFSQLQFAGAFVGTFLFGTLSDLYGRKPISLISLCGALASIVGSALAPSWQILHSFRLLLGLFIGGAIVAFATYVTELILPSQRMVLRGFFNWVLIFKISPCPQLHTLAIL